MVDPWACTYNFGYGGIIRPISVSGNMSYSVISNLVVLAAIAYTSQLFAVVQ